MAARALVALVFALALAAMLGSFTVEVI